MASGRREEGISYPALPKGGAQDELHYARADEALQLLREGIPGRSAWFGHPQVLLVSAYSLIVITFSILGLCLCLEH